MYVTWNNNLVFSTGPCQLESIGWFWPSFSHKILFMFSYDKNNIWIFASEAFNGFRMFAKICTAIRKKKGECQLTFRLEFAKPKLDSNWESDHKADFVRVFKWNTFVVCLDAQICASGFKHMMTKTCSLFSECHRWAANSFPPCLLSGFTLSFLRFVLRSRSIILL
jgi:hypothetical protein